MKSIGFWITLFGLFLGALGGWLYYTLMPCEASCSGSKMSLFIPMFMGTIIGLFASQVLLTFKRFN
jgi:hypothetical protein